MAVGAARRSGRRGADDDEHVDLSAPRGRLAFGTSAFGLLGETLVVGAVVAVVSIPLVTALPAVAAGIRHLRRYVRGEGDAIGGLVRDVGTAVRELWLVGVGLVAALVVLGFNVWLAGTGALPGGQVVGVVTAVLAAAVLVVALRLAAGWSAAGTVGADLRDAGRRSVADPAGSLLLVAALVAAATFVWMLLPMLLLVGGLLALAAMAVEHRWATR